MPIVRSHQGIAWSNVITSYLPKVKSYSYDFQKVFRLQGTKPGTHCCCAPNSRFSQQRCVGALLRISSSIPDEERKESSRPGNRGTPTQTEKYAILSRSRRPSIRISPIWSWGAPAGESITWESTGVTQLGEPRQPTGRFSQACNRRPHFGGRLSAPRLFCDPCTGLRRPVVGSKPPLTLTVHWLARRLESPSLLSRNDPLVV